MYDIDDFCAKNWKIIINDHLWTINHWNILAEIRIKFSSSDLF